MRYRVSFKSAFPEYLPEADKDNFRVRQKRQTALMIGEMINEKVEWTEENETCYLQVEVFTMPEWREFKDEIRMMILNNQIMERSDFDLKQVGMLITKLENKGTEKLKTK